MSEPSKPTPQKPRQPRPDAKLLNLPEERQRQIWEWCKKPSERDTDGDPIPRSGGQAYALDQLAAGGCKVSPDTLSRACSFWRLQEDFTQADTEAKQVEEFLRTEFAEVTPDKIAKAGQLVFTMRAKNANDAEGFVLLENLRLSREIAESKGELEKAKLALKERSVAQKDREIWIAMERLLDDKAEWMLSDAARAKADEINASGMSHADKIKAMRAAAFADVDAMQKSGKVVLPE